MENQQKSQQCLQTMGSKWFILFAFLGFILFSGFECGNKETENQIYISNATGDTIFFTEKLKSSYRRYYMLRPYENSFWGSNTSSIYDIIRDNYHNLDIEIEIYKLACDTCNGTKIQDINSADNKDYYIGNCLVSWAPPLMSLPDSIHSFYNINSWEIDKGGKNNKYDIATFTIKEEDLKQK